MYVRTRVVILGIIIDLIYIIRIINLYSKVQGGSQFDVTIEVDPCEIGLVSYLRRTNRPTYATSKAIELRIVQHVVVRSEACFTLPLSGGVF